MNQKGFTLMEVLAAIMVLGILAALAAPSFQLTIRNNRLSSSANLFLGALNLARSEAVRTNHSVVLCKSQDGATCLENNLGFEQGWMIFVDTDRDLNVGNDDTILRVQDALPGEMTLLSTSSTNHTDDYIAFRGDGRARAHDGRLQNSTLNLCHLDHDPGRVVRINTIGRVRIDTEDSLCAN